MKIWIALTLGFLPLISMAQKPTAPARVQPPPALFVDSQRVTGLYFHPNYIRSIYVSKASDTSRPATQGSIYLAMKKPGVRLVSLQFVSDGLGLARHRKILFFIDGEPIKDTAFVRLDSSFIVQSRLINPSDITYFNASDKTLGIVLISTHNSVIRQPYNGFPVNDNRDRTDTSKGAIIHLRGI